MDNLVNLDMVDINVILCTDSFDTCNASVECSLEYSTFSFLVRLFLEWRNSLSVPKGYFISYHKCRDLVFKG